MHTHVDHIMRDTATVDTHIGAHRSFSWHLKDLTEQIYDNYVQHCYQVYIQLLIQRYLRP
jgi:hypothetical protein